MRSKTLAILFAILLIVVMSVRVPLSNAAPRDYCDGFQNPPVPSLTQEPFVFHTVPTSHVFMPGAVADYDQDGDLDFPYAENLGNWNFRYVDAIENLIGAAGYRALIRANYQNRSILKLPFERMPLDEEYISFHGVAAADPDNDGRQDFMIAPYYQPGVPIMLFHNRGNWQFELSQQNYFQNLLGFNASSDWGSETIIVADLTGDGLNDIYIPFYTHKEPYQSIFLRNSGNGFVEEAMARGLGIPNLNIDLRPEGAQAVDIDSDGDLDIYVAHHLLINDGAGYFTDAREAYGLMQVFDEGAAYIDYDNDGLLDLYLRTWDIDKQLWHNTGSGFVNTSVSSGLACLSQNLIYFWGDSWADFDHDGDLDLLYVHDNWTPKYKLFLNNGDGTFSLGYTGEQLIHLSTTADFDADGDEDVFSLGLWGTTTGTIGENVMLAQPSVGHVLITPVDDQGKLNEQGTTIRMRSDCSPQIQTRVIGTTNTFLQQGEYSAHLTAPLNCKYQIEVAFIRRGALSNQTVTIPYDPLEEGGQKIVVSRSGFTKTSYLYKYQMPVIQKDGSSTSHPQR
jgi:hypothetical protein